MIRLVASDVDGTLVPNGTSQLNPAYFTIIEQLRALGIQFAVASGRQEDSLHRLFAPVKNRIFFISNNGAVLSTASRILFSTPMRQDYLLPLLRQAEQLPGCELLIATSQATYCKQGADAKFLHLLREEYRFTVQEIPDLSAVSSEAVKFSIFHDPSSEHPGTALIEPWKERLSGVISGPEWVDFADPKVQKGNAIRLLQESLGIAPEETMLFGDELNDLSMLRQAMYSYAVGSAKAEVKAAAAYLTKPMMEDGVLDILTKLAEAKGEVAWE
ncbi:HAD family hydrolase [Hominifimenecus sp. rT4P-3]|uniref:HAD family hydrolase n=1 Tax=Hominifimenecus sp. rT4P-3 TaxID=3242979 RepID=UPI003DA48289